MWSSSTTISILASCWWTRDPGLKKYLMIRPLLTKSWYKQWTRHKPTRGEGSSGEEKERKSHHRPNPIRNLPWKGPNLPRRSLRPDRQKKPQTDFKFQKERMKISHIAIWVQDLERMKDFYEMYFSARAGEKYHNPAKS